MMRQKIYKWSVLAGVLSLCATLLWFFFGDRFSVIRSSGNDTFSVSALGHQALTRNLKAAGIPFTVSTYKTAGPAQDADLVVSIEPYLSSTNAITLDAFREFLGTQTPLLVAVPKRWGSPADAKSPHISRHGLESLKDVHWAVDEIQSGIRLRRFPSATCTTAGGTTFVLEDAQLLQTDWGESVISCDQGVLVARMERTWMVFDPDIFSNFRQDEPVIAEVSRALLHEAANGGRIVFDETAHGHIKPPTIGRFLTSWPMGALTAHLFFAFALLVWFASVRLGRPKDAQLDLPLGKAGMIANAADLMMFGGHSGHMIGRYVRAVFDDIGLRLHAQKTDERQQLAWIQQRVDARGLEVDVARLLERADALAFARGPTLDRQILVIAREAYSLRQELLNDD